jgi:hypothetical protein
MRPVLLPGLPRVWRGPHTLQLGLHPGRAILLDLPDPRAAGLLDLLDGTRPEAVFLRQAATVGLPTPEAHDLLDSLRRAGLLLAGRHLLPPALTGPTRRRLTAEATALALTALALTAQGRPTVPIGAPAHEVGAVDGHRPLSDPQAPGGSGLSDRSGLSPAQILRRRMAAKVVVTGRGRLAAPIAVALAESGVGHVEPDLPGPVGEADLPGSPLQVADLGLPRRAAVAAAVQRAAPGTVTRQLRRGSATLTVQLGYDQPVALLAASYASRRQPHLVVAIREGTAAVGPFVPAVGGPCLQCLDLHRRDRDAGWPDLMVQLAPEAPEPCGVCTLLAATAFATAEALAFLDGALPETVGAAVEITAPGRFRRRSWPAHPACGCSPRRLVMARAGAGSPPIGRPAEAGTASPHFPSGTIRAYQGG